MKKVTKDLEKIVYGMTPKQAKFFDLWLKTGNGTKSAMQVYDCKDVNTAAAIANENLRKLKNPMKVFLENNGIGITHLVKVVLDGMQAEKTDITGDKHPDHKIRLEASDRLSRWLDVEPLEDAQIKQAVQINIHSALLEKYGQ